MAHWPDDIKSTMGDRNVLTVALDIVGGVRGSRDMALSECAMDLNVLDWYETHWTPSDCPFDAAALECIRHARRVGNEWFMRESARMGLGT